MVVKEVPEIRPLQRAEYDKLVELGMFEDERIELLEGALVEMSPSGPPHSSTVDKLNMLLAPALVGLAIVRVQGPFAAERISEPEPDVFVIPLGNYERTSPPRDRGGRVVDQERSNHQAAHLRATRCSS